MQFVLNFTNVKRLVSLDPGIEDLIYSTDVLISLRNKNLPRPTRLCTLQPLTPSHPNPLCLPGLFEQYDLLSLSQNIPVWKINHSDILPSCHAGPCTIQS